MSETGSVLPAESDPVESGPMFRWRNPSPLDWCFLLLIVLYLGTGLASINDVNLYTPDSTHYLVWAKSLAGLQGFRDATGPEIHRYVINAPLYALFLVPAALFFPMSLLAAKVLTLLWGAALLTLCYTWTCRLGGKGAALTACLLLAANPIFLTYSTEVLSDIPFGAIFFILLLLISSRDSQGVTGWRLAGMVAAVSAAVLLREVGFALMIAATLYLVFSGRKREAYLVAMVPVLVYLLWLLRNEVIVGSVEMPTLTNSRLLTHHFFTMPDSWIGAEFLARVWMNIKGYTRMMGGLLLFPMYGSGDLGLLPPQDPIIATVKGVLSGFKYLLALVSVAGFVSGVMYHRGRGGEFKLVAWFLLCYAGIILLYPINDVRFLFPLLVIGAAYAALGWRRFFQRMSGRSHQPHGLVIAGAVVALLIVLLPNTVWIARSIACTAKYRAAEEDGFTEATGTAGLPRRYRLPLRLAGAWLEKNTSPASVIMSRFVDLAPCLDDRRISILGDRSSVEGIESAIRDYGIEYIVTADDGSGLWIGELQMRESSCYGFSLVHRIGDIGIFHVDTRPDKGGLVDGCEDIPKRRGLSLLIEGRYHDAEQFLSPGAQSVTVTPSELFLYALDREYSMDLKGADECFAQFGGFQQAEEYIDEAAVHRQLISIVRAAMSDRNPGSASRGFFTASAGYWDLGSRRHARMLMDRAIQLDSANTPAYVLGFHFALAQRDTTSAESYVRASVRRDPNYELNPVLQRIIAAFDSLGKQRGSAERAGLHLELAQAFGSLKMTGDAVDNLILSATENPRNPTTLMLLASHYASGDRFTLATRSLKQVLSLEPGNGEAKRAMQELESRL